MAKGNISKKQEEILQYIKDQILQRGFPPAVREICEAVHLKSTSSVHSHLETLEKNGYIRRDPTKPRAIEILDDDFNLLRREMVQVPIVGRVAAGEPILAQQNIEDYFPFPAEYVSNKHLRDSPPAAGRICDMFLIRRSAILAEHFLCNGNEVSYYIKKRVYHNIVYPNLVPFTTNLAV